MTARLVTKAGAGVQGRSRHERVIAGHPSPASDRRHGTLLPGIWQLLVVAVLLSGCSLMLPAIRGPIDIDCHDVSDAECDEAWAAAQDRFPSDWEIEGGTVSRAGGAAECWPDPCADLFSVMLDLRNGQLRAISLERNPDGLLVVTDVEDLIT